MFRFFHNLLSPVVCLQEMQAQFDKLVEEFSKDSTIDDAIREAIECMQESGSNLDTVFLYENSIELTEKIKMEAKYITIEKASRQQESFVNATFAMQGMKQILCGSESDKVTIGSWKLIESRNFFHSVLNLIPPLEDDDNANEGKMIDEEDSDEDEDEEATNAVIIQSLQFACMLLRSGMSVNHRIRDPQNTFSVDSERFQFLCAKFDEVMSAPE